MPLNGSGTASPPSGAADFAPNTTIESAILDALRDDIYSIFNTARPIAYGGTGAATAIQAIDNLLTISDTIASATTADLSAATGINVTITGTTTITGLGTEQGGALRLVTFADALTLTHNSSSLILPSGANITTSAGDVALFASLGSGNWRCISYSKADGTPVGFAVLDDDSFATATSTDPSSSEATKTYVDGKFINNTLQLITAVSYGSTATRILRYSTIATNSPGSSMTLAQSSANGDSVTINIAGMYVVEAELQCSNSDREFGITVNQSDLTANITSLASGQILASSTATSTDRRHQVTYTGYLSASDVVRVNTDGGTLSTGTRDCSFKVTRIW